MNPLLKSAVGSIALRASLITVGYLAALDEADDLPYFLAILLVLLIIGWIAENASLNSWHQYKAEKERGDG
ncbi:hypothetical protein SEA_JFLIX2_78 [Rhodococcus phage Jflix2]|nr:hypothetical protein SEA_JFLIX2_78 [Rhodococcus phage Jflix2]